MTEPSTEEYRTLLRAALPQTADADTTDVRTQTLFTAPQHRRALEPDATVVRGGRGVGKTVWYTTLLDQRLREVAADEYQLPVLRRVQPLRGFGAERDIEAYPTRGVLEQLISDGARPRHIWTAVALNALRNKDISELSSWSERVRWATENRESAERALQQADREAEAEGEVKLFLFDALDRLHENRHTADQLTGSILQFALDLRIETHRLRAKVFVRDDMMDSAATNFPDSSKLLSNAVHLTWSRVDLYGLLFQHLGNKDIPVAETFRQHTGPWQSKPDRFVPPRSLTSDEATQHTIFEQMAGEYMGRNHRRGRTYPWLPNHLADGRGQTSPRSFLVALRTAAETTEHRFAAHHRALHWDAIKEGVQVASGTRVAEVKEDLPWVALAIEPLKGTQVPIERDEVLNRWDKAHLTTVLCDLAASANNNDVRTGPKHPDQPAKLLDELVELGVLTQRANGKLDLPDVFRIAFDIGRKGGVPRVKS